MHTIGLRPSTSLCVRECTLSNPLLGTGTRALLTISAWASPCWRCPEGHPPGRASRPSQCLRRRRPPAALRVGVCTLSEGAPSWRVVSTYATAFTRGQGRNRQSPERPLSATHLRSRSRDAPPRPRTARDLASSAEPNAPLLPRPDAPARRAPLPGTTASDAALPDRRATRGPSAAGCRTRRAGCRSPAFSYRSARGHAPSAAGRDTDAARALPAQCQARGRQHLH